MILFKFTLRIAKFPSIKLLTSKTIPKNGISNPAEEFVASLKDNPVDQRTLDKVFLVLTSGGILRVKIFDSCFNENAQKMRKKCNFSAMVYRELN